MNDDQDKIRFDKILFWYNNTINMILSKISSYVKKIKNVFRESYFVTTIFVKTPPVKKKKMPGNVLCERIIS